jgi:hypothetical protein
VVCRRHPIATPNNPSDSSASVAGSGTAAELEGPMPFMNVKVVPSSFTVNSAGVKPFALVNTP